MKLLEPGQRLGTFEIVRQLDAGGMGMVYEAVHAKLGTRHAVKVFATESQRQEFLRKRFLVEGKLLAKFRHPNIVHVTDMQIDKASGVPYFAMDLVLSPNGAPLTLEGARQKGVDEEQVAGWLRDICNGLGYIHSKGVVHRDISLENVMVGPDGHAVITDFGISRIFDNGLRQHVELTRFTMVELGTTELKMGKVPYMAPELTRKMPAHASPASDAYALGVLIFRLLTGFWFERDNRGNSMDMLAGLKYDWATLLNRLLDDHPTMRLPQDGIAAVPILLTPHKPRRKWKRIIALFTATVLVVTIVIEIIVWTKGRADRPAAEVHRASPPQKTNTTLRVSTTIDPNVLSDLENAIMPNKGNQREESEK